MIGLCGCGCGSPTKLDWRGAPRRFLLGHHNRSPPCDPQLCACGCGQYTTILKGKPHRFVRGHHARGEHNGRFGKPVSSETTQKQAAAGRRQAAAGLSAITQPGWKHSEVTRAKMSAAHALNLRTGSKNPFYGKKHSEETLAKMAASRATSIVLPTTPERAVHAELVRRGIGFLTEHQIGRFCVDILVPNVNLVIFVDGCYWHACPAHHPTNRRPSSDASRVSYLTKCGYRVAIIWEHEIHADVMTALDPWLEAPLVQ